MTTKVFNTVSVVVFAILAIMTFVAGFYNPIHFALSVICVFLATLAFFDDSHGKSLYQRFKDRNDKLL